MTFGRNFTEQHERRQAEREANLKALTTPSRGLHRGSYEGGTSAAAPKVEPYRDAALLDMARGRACLLMIPGLCNHRTDTTVACHSNLSIHGKAAARKADDCFSVFGCTTCHLWLDTSKALAGIKEVAFMTAHARQVLAWRLIALDASEPERFRAAARRALRHLNVTQIGETA